jgi:hypothetical protein
MKEVPVEILVMVENSEMLEGKEETHDKVGRGRQAQCFGKVR